MMGKDKNKDKEHQDGETTTSSESTTSPQDTHQSNRELSQDREARDTTLAKTIAEAVAREMAKAHVQYQALLNDRSTAVIPISIKVTVPRTRLSTRDGNCGWRRLDSPLMPWKVTQKRLGFLNFTIGSIEGYGTH